MKGGHPSGAGSGPTSLRDSRLGRSIGLPVAWWSMDVVEALGLDSLLGQFVVALGGALVLGNGYAIYQARRGEGPQGESGEFRTGRAWWLLAVGVIILIWGLVSLIAG